jgi:peptidoglycan/xylan/chitin deacetylase (PgdA/CDA1 family)
VGGGYNDELLFNLVAMDMKLVMWNYDPCDWAQTNCKEIAAGAEHVFSGAIILLHELKQTADALPEFVETLLSKNCIFSTLDEIKSS